MQPIYKNVHEIFDELELRATKKDRLAVLRYNATPTIKAVLKNSFDPGIQFLITEEVNYKKRDTPIGFGNTSISNELRSLYLFEKNNLRAPAGLTERRRKEILAQILESLEAKEAIIFMNMLLKKQKVRGLTYNLVKEAFPELLP